MKRKPMKTISLIPMIFMLFACTFQSYARPKAEPTKDEARLKQMLAEPDNTDKALDRLLSLIIKGDIQHKGMLLMSMETNAGESLAGYANTEVVKWLKSGFEASETKPTYAPLLLCYCRSLPEKAFRSIKIDYASADQRKEIMALKAGLALGDPEAVNIMEQKLSSTNLVAVEFALQLLKSNQYSVSVKIPLALFEEALKKDSKHIPVEAYLQQLFLTKPENIQTRLSRVFAHHPEAGYRLTYIMGVNDVLGTPFLANALCKSLQANPEAMLQCASYYSNMGHGYQVASLIESGGSADWFFQLMKQSLDTKDDYRMSLLDVAAALNVKGFDDLVNIPKDKIKYRYGKLSEKVDFLYTLRCGSDETKLRFLRSLDEMDSFDIQRAFLEASLAKSEKDALVIINAYKKEMNQEPEEKGAARTWRMYDRQRQSDFILCFSHLQSAKFLGEKWEYFTQLTRNIDFGKTRHMLIKDLKGKIPYRDIRMKITEELKSERRRSVHVPMLHLLTSADLREYKKELEQIIGHVGIQAEMLSVLFASAGIEGYRYVVFRAFD